jgi:hypothetical protein
MMTDFRRLLMVFLLLLVFLLLCPQPKQLVGHWIGW